MKRAAFIPILLGFAATVLAQIAPPKIPQPDLTRLVPVKVIRIVDGDTLVVGNLRAPTKIRLLGVDAPESNQPNGSAATQFLARLLDGERVFVETDPNNEKDVYGRTLAYLYRAPDGLLVNLEIVRQGYGRVYRKAGFKYWRLFVHYEGVAQAAKRGVWSQEFKRQKQSSEEEIAQLLIKLQIEQMLIDEKMARFARDTRTGDAEMDALLLDFEQHAGESGPLLPPGSAMRHNVWMAIESGGESWGKIVIELNEKKAPITVKNFLRYVDEGYYNGLVFHRVIPNGMIQGGGFTLKSEKRSEGLHGPIQNEAKNGLKNARGTIAMTGAPMCQFFINVVDNAHLDYPSIDGWGYCVFGKVVKGMDVVDRIRRVPTRRNRKIGGTPSPITAIVIKKAARE